VPHAVAGRPIPYWRRPVPMLHPAKMTTPSGVAAGRTAGRWPLRQHGPEAGSSESPVAPEPPARQPLGREPAVGPRYPAAAVDEVDVVVDVANVMGSRPDGWWRDRGAAALRLMRGIAPLAGRRVDGPDGVSLLVCRLVAVVEGQARSVPVVAGVEVVRASADGDSALVETCAAIAADGRRPLAVTADRGLRERLPPGTTVAGPRWLLALVE
jgi:hypothetical protein